MSSKTLFRLSYLELKRAFCSNGSAYSRLKFPGYRDFRWVFLFLTLAQFFLMILVGLQTGMVNRLLDTFLNSVPNYGVPIWVQENIHTQLITSGIPPETIDELNRTHIAFPFRTVTLSGHGARLRLPGMTIWEKHKDDISENLNGRGLSPDDPLWKSSGANNDADIVLNHALLAPHGEKPRFNLAHYRQALKDSLPTEIARASLSPLQTAACPIWDGDDEALLGCELKSLSTLWLEAERVGRNNIRILERIPLRIRWADNIIAAEPIGFLLTLPNYHRWYVVHQSPDSRYFPEWDAFYQEGFNGILGGGGVSGGAEDINSRAERLIVSGKVTDGVLTQLARRLNGRGNKVADGIWTIEFPFPIPLWSASAIGRELGLTELNWNTVSASGLTVTKDGIQTSCKSVSGIDVIDNDTNDRCKDGRQLFAWADSQYGYPYLIMYVKDRDGLLAALKSLQFRKELRLHDAYRDALTKASYLTAIIDVCAPVIGLLALAVITFMCAIQISVVVGHRRSNYGLMLSHGVHVSGIYGIVLTQLTAITAAAGVAAVLLAQIVEIASTAAIRAKSLEFTDKVAGAGQAVIELDGWQMGMVGLVMQLIIISTATFMLHRNGVTPRPRIAALLPK